MRFTHALVAFLATAVAAAGLAQEPAFDVASIRPSAAEGATAIRPMANGRLTASRASLRSLVLRAYGLHDSQLVGGPAWIDVDRYDIDARAAAAPAGGPEALMPMLRTLLASRFRLRMHAATRELPAYVLVHARRDKALGPQIRPTQADCSRATVLTEPELIAATRDGQWPPCGQVSAVSSVVKTDAGSMIRLRIRRSAVTMKDFVATFDMNVGRPIIDRTGLEGRFDVEYSFAPPRPQDAAQSAPSPGAPPTLFVALEEQLGLKLEPERAAVPVLVIDSVEQPTAN